MQGRLPAGLGLGFPYTERWLTTRNEPIVYETACSILFSSGLCRLSYDLNRSKRSAALHHLGFGLPQATPRSFTMLFTCPWPLGSSLATPGDVKSKHP